MYTQRLSFLLILTLFAQLAVSQTPFRFEAETGISSLRLPQPYRSGWHVRQQLTGYIRPRLGVALGVGWGGSANNDPLRTQNPAGGPAQQPDPRALLDFYNRQEQMTDLSVVWLPLLTRRHQVKVQAGLSLQRRREVNVDSIYRETINNVPTPAFYEAIPTYTDTRQVVPMLSVGYDVRLSTRWAVGANAVTYLASASKGMTTFGLRTTYRFNISRDSLGIRGSNNEPLAWGLRVAANRVGQNGGSNTATRNVTRFAGGLWAEYPLSLTWSVRGEVNYTSRGYQIDGYRTSTISARSTTASDTYLEVPLLFRHEAAERFHLFFGPYLAFLLQGSTQQEGSPAVPTRSHTNSGLILGADYRLSRQLTLDLRYGRDLIQLSTTPYNNSYHSYQLGLNWQLR